MKATGAMVETMVDSMTDYGLVQRSLMDDQEAFAELVARYRKLVYSAVLKYFRNNDEADDIAQEVFLKIYRHLDKYDPQYRFSTWTMKIASNLCLDCLRKKHAETVPMDEIEMLSRNYDTPERRYIGKERSMELRGTINKLPEKYRTPVLLYHVKGLSYKEIAERLGKPMSIVKNRLFRARALMRESLSSLDIAAPVG